MQTLPAQQRTLAVTIQALVIGEDLHLYFAEYDRRLARSGTSGFGCVTYPA